MLHYARLEGAAHIEVLSFRVKRVEPLSQHFHDEAQVSLVLSGRRRFAVADREVELGVGSFCVFPPRVPHQATDALPGTLCLNLYLPPDHPLLASIQASRALPDFGRDAAWFEGDAPVAELAVRSAMSREGLTRRFSRRHGMPPQAFRRMLRLNRARRLLRSGMGVADVAAETGFADQSHLGRWFRQAFGTTPARYRIG